MRRKATKLNFLFIKKLDIIWRKKSVLKIKLIAIAFILSLVGIVFYGSHRFSVSANNAADEIANYKTWSRITKEPVKVEINEAALSG